MLFSWEPRGPGGEVLPIMESFFSNDGQIMHMNIINLILVWHCCWASNTRWLEKILKKKDWEPYSATNIRSFTTLNLPTMKTNKQQQQNNKIYIRILMYKVKSWLCPQLVRDFYTTQQPPPYNMQRWEFVLPRFVTVTYGKRSSWNSHVNYGANLSLARRKRDFSLLKNERHNCRLCNFYSFYIYIYILFHCNNFKLYTAFL